MRYLIVFYLLSTAFFAQAKVSIQVNHEMFYFAENPRLVDILSEVTGDNPWFWPASRLYRLNSSEAEQQRNDIVSELKFISISANKELIEQIHTLINEIQQWPLADRVDIIIDYDAAQMNANNNPRFENGDYLLELSLRPTATRIFGLSLPSLPVNMSDDQCAHHYIQNKNIKLANYDSAYIIQANGQTKKIGIAYWNQKCVELMPGSEIYLPLPESQFSEKYRTLNQKIAMLAKNRIVL
tara:strand:+ start:1297 stop:2016 length:720 start_codon:yes stop_codon:yes gene_type:complete